MTSIEERQEDRPSVAWGLLLVRVVVGVIFAVHGSQKLLPVFGGPMVSRLVGMLGWVGYLVAVDELFGGLGLIFGILSRFSAFWLIVDMVGAVVLVHGRNGFFLGTPPGFEYNLALIGLLAMVLLAGPGRFSLARWLPRSYRAFLG